MGFQGSEETRVDFWASEKDVDFHESETSLLGSGDPTGPDLRDSGADLRDSTDTDTAGFGAQGDTVEDFCTS